MWFNNIDLTLTHTDPRPEARSVAAQRHRETLVRYVWRQSRRIER